MRPSDGAGVPVNLPELLAPAGSPESLRAAIAAGADAVYLGGKRFGARRSAANFSDDEIREGIRLAHSRGVRVYVTVNTLIHDRELEGVAEYLVWLYEAGADAVLVQDAGVAALAREIVPGLTLHASTQMTVHNSDGVLDAADQGFSRVVLARELPLAEIRTIAEATQESGVGLEIFAHGALCYSYSGQCLLSSFIGGRSGNRGMCAQPCRKPYTLVTGETDAFGRPERLRELPVPGPYLLSPRDLSTYRHLPELVRSPVAALKIEGRMKSPEYVAIVVSTYRRALDAIARGSWRPEPEAERDLLLAFSRGFTKGYLFGDRHGSLMARDAPDNRGICIGRVLRQDNRTGEVVIRLDGTLIPATGDGLLFSGPAGKRETDWGFSLNNVPVRRDEKTISLGVPRPVAAGSSVYITFSRDLEMRARQIAARPPPDLVRRVPIDLSIGVRPDGHLILDGRMTSGRGTEVRVSFETDLLLVPARSRPLTARQLEAQLRKTGDTPFMIRTCVSGYDGTLFAPVGELNRVRREFLARAGAALLAASIPPPADRARSRESIAPAFREHAAPAPGAGEPGIGHGSPGIIVYADTAEAAAMAAKEGCAGICFEPAYVLPGHTCGAGDPGELPPFRERVREVMDLCREHGTRFVLKLPRITSNGFLDAILPAISELHGTGLGACMVETAGAARAVHARVPAMELHGAAGLNVFNHRSACHYSLQFRSLTLSPELSRDECRALVRAARGAGCSPAFALVVQGIGEAMITEDCPLAPVQKCHPAGREGAGAAFTGIRDATGRVFPVFPDGECRNRIGNAVETSLIDQLPAIREAGITEIVIDARGRTGAWAGTMTRIYRDALAGTGRDAGGKESTGRCKERVKALAYGGITAGHFLRGVE